MKQSFGIHRCGRGDETSNIPHAAAAARLKERIKIPFENADVSP